MPELKLYQYQKLSQELRLSPQQILQSTILQLTTLALEARVNQELEQNPVLEEVDSDDKEVSELDSQDNPTEDDHDVNWEELLPQNDDYEPKREFDPNKRQIMLIQPAVQSLVDHLLDQLKLLNLSDVENQIATQIIWSLDDRGYLALPLENIAFTFDVTEAQVEKVLNQIQHLDPVGIAARDLRECLLIQLGEMSDVDDAVAIVRDHFDDFANRRFEKIMNVLGWGREKIHAVQNVILRLNPKPGAGLKSTDQNYIVPDLIVEKVGDDYIVEVNDSYIPELRVSPTYLRMMSKGSSISRDAKVYIKKKIELAKWFMQSVHQRRVTMMRVMKAIINRQREFFEGNEKALKPMILKDIADDIGMDISTISRVTNGKYVQLDSGIHELKYFFSEGMINNTGEEVSTRIIKDKLKQIIDSEDKQRPYSDDKLSMLLKREGNPIARRTVAKYREQMRIPVARLRRNI